MSNGLVTLTMAKSGNASRAGLSSLQIHAVGGVNLLGNGGSGYYDINTNDFRLEKPYCQITSTYSNYEVLRKTDTLLEVGFHPKASCGFETSLHYVLKAGESGFYMWAVVHTDPAVVAIQEKDGHANNISLGQSRMVLRVDPSIFIYNAVVDESSGKQPQTMRTHLFPKPKQLSAPFAVMDATFRLANGSSGYSPLAGSYYTKYEWASMAAIDSVHGPYGPSPNGDGFVGAFVISASNEYLNGGPSHPELSTHATDTTPCLLKMTQGGHQDFYDPTPDAAAPKNWTKLHGPWFVSLATAPTAAQLWADAAALALRHQGEWPYAWMDADDALYAPAKQRGSVRGTVALPSSMQPRGLSQNPLSPSFVILGEKGSTKAIAAQGGHGNLYWGRISCSGNSSGSGSGNSSSSGSGSGSNSGSNSSVCSWSVENVPAGEYALWVRLPGALPLEQLIRPAVTVRAGGATDAGELRAGSALGDQSAVVWQIGEVDASVAEFKYGREAELHVWAKWLDIADAKLINASINLGPLIEPVPTVTGTSASASAGVSRASLNRTRAQAVELPFMQPLLGQTVGVRDVSSWTIRFPRLSAARSSSDEMLATATEGQRGAGGGTDRGGAGGQRAADENRKGKAEAKAKVVAKGQGQGQGQMRLLIGLSSAPTLRNDHGLKYEVFVNSHPMAFTIRQGAHLSNTSDIFACPFVAGERTPPATTHVDVRSGVRSGVCPGVQLWVLLNESMLSTTATPKAKAAAGTSAAAGASADDNLIELRLSGQTGSLVCGPNKGGQPRVACPSAAVLYDFIRLERLGG
eukprot:g1181.t1